MDTGVVPLCQTFYHSETESPILYQELTLKVTLACSSFPDCTALLHNMSARLTQFLPVATVPIGHASASIHTLIAT